MPRTQFISGQSKTEQLSSFTLIAVTRLAIGLIIVALIVIGLTNPSGAQVNRGATAESTPSSDEQKDDNGALFGRCLQDWDAGTHMTKKGMVWRMPASADRTWGPSSQTAAIIQQDEQVTSTTRVEVGFG
jgi:hypothetical protein